MNRNSCRTILVKMTILFTALTTTVGCNLLFTDAKIVETDGGDTNTDADTDSDTDTDSWVDLTENNKGAWPHENLRYTCDRRFLPGSPAILETTAAFVEKISDPTLATITLSGDIDGSGTPSLIGFSDGNLHIWSSELSSHLVIDTCADSGIGNCNISGLDLADMDQDGQTLEIVVAISSGTISVNNAAMALVYDGNGTLLKSIQGPDCERIGGLFGVDLDHDGSMETVMITSAGYPGTPRRVAVYDYASGEENWRHDMGPIPTSLSVADLDGDGSKEVIVGSYATNNGVVVNDTSDSFAVLFVFNAQGERLWFREFGNDRVSQMVTDMNKDGSPEVLSLEHHNSPYPGVSALRLLDPADGSTIHSYTTPQGENRWSIGFTDDVDEDGDVELVIGLNDNSIRVFGPTLEAENSLVVSSQPGSVTGVDLNGNGHTEILVKYGDGTLAVYPWDLGTENWIYNYGNPGDQVMAILTDLVPGAASEIVLSGDIGISVLGFD